MSLVLDGDPKTSQDIEVKTRSLPQNLLGVVEIRHSTGHIEISYRDFLAMAHYVLTNTDLEENDPRLAFVKAVGKLQVGLGFNGPLGARLIGPYPEM